MELKRYCWASIQDYIKKINPDFSAVIDKISPSEKYAIYHVKYPYGALILDKGVFHIPNRENFLVPISHSSVPNSIKEDLGYTDTMPMGMILENSIETFFVTKDRIIPASLFKKGDLVSLWCVLEDYDNYHKGPLWSITSGARTICMLPKITDKNSYRQLKLKYGLKSPIPKSLNDHWEIFFHLTSHEKFINNWSSEIILFGKKWFENKNDFAWTEFYRYLLKEAWAASSFRRNQFIFDFAFSLIQKNKNLKPNPYLADTVRHLIAVGSGSSPAFTPAIDDTAAPILRLQEVFLRDYGLKKYAPVIMHLHHFSAKERRPVYYSFEMPTTTVFSPRSSRISSKMTDMRELKYILEVLLSEILKGNVDVHKTPLYEIAKNVKYNFYHTDRDQYSEIANTLNVLHFDQYFSANSFEYAFPEFSPFFRGCISVSSSLCESL